MNFSYNQYAQEEDDTKGNSKRVDPNFIAGMFVLLPFYLNIATLSYFNLSNLMLPYRQEIRI